MLWKNEWKMLLLMVGGFAVCFYLPVGAPRFNNAILESLYLVKWYAEEHVVLCLVPALFIAGAVSVFVSQASVMKYLGPKANKFVAYGVSSVSGTILAVCSCTVLPLFSGIRRMGAGLGPATAFLYSGPAINILAIVLTARVLGIRIGIARAVGAIVFSIVIGVLMHLIFREDETEKTISAMNMGNPDVKRPLWKNVAYFTALISILVFANWGRPLETQGLWYFFFKFKWMLTTSSAVLLSVMLVRWFQLAWWKVLIAGIPVVMLAVLFPGNPLIAFAVAWIGLSVIASTDHGETGPWFWSSWDFAKQILPLLFLGVLFAGFLLGRPGKEGLIPSEWVTRAVGGNSLAANVFASIAGAFMYFATLTEIPIVQGLIGSGMGKGPALALLLAGPALSLPSMLVIKRIIGLKKTVVYVTLVVAMATVSGYLFGAYF